LIISWYSSYIIHLKSTISEVARTIGSNFHVLFNNRIEYRDKTPYFSFSCTLKVLVGPDQPASAFLIVQLRGLEARGHKSNLPKRQRTPFRHVRLMLVASGQSPSAFLIVQLRRVVPRGHFLRIPKGKERLQGFSRNACRA